MQVNRSLVLSVLVLPALMACGGGVEAIASPPIMPPQSPPPPPIVNAVHGRYVGTVRVRGVDYFADAFLTPGGKARIYFGGPDAFGAIPATPADTAWQFVGDLALGQGGAAGSGLVIGEGCAVSAITKFCDEVATAELRFPNATAGYDPDLEGSLTVTTAQEVEVWALTLFSWNNVYPFEIPLAYAAGQYREMIAEFVADEDTVVVIDDTGRLFFQSPGSGCTGNGLVTPDANFAVLEISLTIEACSGAFAYLDGSHSGFGTFSTSDYWGTEPVWLRMWLSKSDVASPPAAFTMWGRPF